MAQRRQFSTFWVEGLFFGIEVEQVQEVIRYQEITRTPLSPHAVRGLINLRGNIVTALDLRQKLHLGERLATERPMNVVVRNHEEAVSLLVDEIGDVLELDDAAYEPPPASLPEKTRELIRGVYKLEGRLMHLVDLNSVIG